MPQFKSAKGLKTLVKMQFSSARNPRRLTYHCYVSRVVNHQVEFVEIPVDQPAVRKPHDELHQLLEHRKRVFKFSDLTRISSKNGTNQRRKNESKNRASSSSRSAGRLLQAARGKEEAGEMDFFAS